MRSNSNLGTGSQTSKVKMEAPFFGKEFNSLHLLLKGGGEGEGEGLIFHAVFKILF